MTNSLLVVAFADGESVKHSLRYATEYALPDVYQGNATLSPIQNEVSKDSFTSIFHCKDCLRWNQGEGSGKASTSSGNLNLAWAMNEDGPGGCAEDLMKHTAQGTWVGFVEGAPNKDFDEWAGMAGQGGKC